MKLIDKDVLTEKLWERRIKHRDFGGSPYSEYGHEDDEILSLINSLEVKEVDLELIVGWFEHIAQMADDRKTLNGEVMDDWGALDEIKCLAKNSADFIQRHYKAQKGECV